MPTILVAPAAAIAWCSGAILWRAGARPRRLRPIILFIGVWVIAVIAYFTLVELRVYRLPLRARPPGPHIRILNWNVTAVQRLEQITGPVQAQNPDIAILVNPHSYVGWSQVPAAFGTDYRFLNVGGIVTLSRIPILRHGIAWLGLETLPPETQSTTTRRSRIDPGRAMFIEFDTSAALGKTTTVWVFDLPSNPQHSRSDLAEHAAAIIRDWNGVVIHVGPEGMPLAGDTITGFPAPDVALGDFNIPRGSASLSRLLPGMRNAFDQAGAGYGATWPRYGYRTPIPLIQIDQMFIADSLRAARYEVVNPGFGFHQMQVGDLVAP